MLNALHDKEISDVAIALRIGLDAWGSHDLCKWRGEMTAAGNSEYVLLERNWEDGDVIMAKISDVSGVCWTFGSGCRVCFSVRTDGSGCKTWKEKRWERRHGQELTLPHLFIR